MGGTFMSTKALIKGQVYSFLELLPSLDQNENMILCTNTSGEKYVCATRVCLKTGNVPSGERFFRQIRRFDAGILSYCKSNQRNMTEKDPLLGYVIQFSNRL